MMLWTVLLNLLAQANETDPVSGGAGWVGAGLLGLVLSWLLFIHLPAKDKQMRELINQFDAALLSQRKDYREELRLERDAWERSIEKVSKMKGPLP